MKIALITGASSGIGKETAIIFAKNGYNLILCARRTEILSKLSQEIISLYNVKVYPITLDIRNSKQVQTQLNNLPLEWTHIDVLINNAGLALGLNTIDEGIIDNWEKMIDTNLKGLLYMTKYSIPYLLKSSQAHIINIGSIAGKETYLNGNVYCATKHAVNSLTKAMRIDLLKKNIKVSQIAPGAVETEFSIVRYKGDKKRADNVYKNYKPLTGADVAEAIYYVTSLPPHVNINDLVIMPTAQASAGIFNKKNQ